MIHPQAFEFGYDEYTKRWGYLNPHTAPPGFKFEYNKEKEYWGYLRMTDTPNDISIMLN